MKKQKSTFRRATAYFIDLFIVLLISSMFARIDALNPYSEQYEKTYNEYTSMSKEIVNKSGKIDREKLNNISYDLNKYGLPISLINIVVTFLYFGLFQYYNKGQTIGKKLCKIKVVSTKGKKLNFVQMMGRTLIINSVLASSLVCLSIALLSKSAYLNVNNIVSSLDTCVIIASIMLILYRNDGRGIHDLLLKTEVVPESYQTKKIKEAKVSKEKEL